MSNTIKIKESLLREIIRNRVITLLEGNARPVTIQELNAWFDEFNQKYFGNSLPKVPIKLEPIAAHTWGRFQSGQQYYERTRKKTGPFIPEKASITINSAFNGTEYNIRNTLLHEMVHLKVASTIDYVPTRHHGWEFMNEAYRINSITKQIGDNFNVTAKSDCVENEVSDVGLERYKNRITDDYLFGVMYGGKFKYFLFRTQEKYINYYINTFPNARFEWYKVKSNNPMLGVQQRICNKSILGFGSNVSVEDLFNRLRARYGDVEVTKYEPEIIGKISGKEYYLGICIDYRDNTRPYWVFKTQWAYVSKLQQVYYNCKFKFIPVTQYDIRFDSMKTSMSKIRDANYGSTLEEALMKLLKRASFQINQPTDIKI